MSQQRLVLCCTCTGCPNWVANNVYSVINIQHLWHDTAKMSYLCRGAAHVEVISWQTNFFRFIQLQTLKIRDNDIVFISECLNLHQRVYNCTGTTQFLRPKTANDFFVNMLYYSNIIMFHCANTFPSWIQVVSLHLLYSRLLSCEDFCKTWPLRCLLTVHTVISMS